MTEPVVLNKLIREAQDGVFVVRAKVKGNGAVLAKRGELKKHSVMRVENVGSTRVKLRLREIFLHNERGVSKVQLGRTVVE